MMLFIGVHHLVLTMDEPWPKTTGVTLNLTAITRFQNLHHLWLFDKHFSQKFHPVISLENNHTSQPFSCIKHLHIKMRTFDPLPQFTCLETLDIYILERYNLDSFMEFLENLKGNPIRSIALHEESMYIHEKYSENRVLNIMSRIRGVVPPICYGLVVCLSSGHCR